MRQKISLLADYDNVVNSDYSTISPSGFAGGNIDFIQSTAGIFQYAAQTGQATQVYNVHSTPNSLGGVTVSCAPPSPTLLPSPPTPLLLPRLSGKVLTSWNSIRDPARNARCRFSNVALNNARRARGAAGQGRLSSSRARSACALGPPYACGSAALQLRHYSRRFWSREPSSARGRMGDAIW